MVISTRKPDPLVISLADAAGKTFRQGGSTARVETRPAKTARIQLLTLILSEDAHVSARGRVSSGPQPDRLSDLLPNRLEFEDAEGHRLNWLLPGQPFAGTSGELRVQVFLSGLAARLRVYGLNRLATEIPFAFDDVPAP